MFYRVQVRVEQAHVVRRVLGSPVGALELVARRAAVDEVIQLVAAVVLTRSVMINLKLVADIELRDATVAAAALEPLAHQGAQLRRDAHRPRSVGSGSLVRRTRGRLKPSTQRAYRKELMAATAALPETLEQVTTAHLTPYFAADVAPSTVARRLAALRSLFGWAVREGYITTDPTLSLEAPRRTRRLPRPIRAETARQSSGRLLPRHSHFASR